MYRIDAVIIGFPQMEDNPLLSYAYVVIPVWTGGENEYVDRRFML